MGIYNIAVIKGDGIGPEVVESAIFSKGNTNRKSVV